MKTCLLSTVLSLIAAVSMPACVKGPSSGLRTASTGVFGYADVHNHQFAYLGFGGLAVVGTAFSPDDSIATSLAPDTPVHGLWHLGDPISLFDGPRPGMIGNGGYPDFQGWPNWSSIDHQQVYYEWLKRAYDGGLRLLSVLAVSNTVLCELLQEKKGQKVFPSCSDMEAVDRQIQAAVDLEAYIDKKDGGAGKGWYRIARSSREARSILNEGKLVVVLGIEVSDLFDCMNQNCTEADVDRKLHAYHEKGVRQVLAVHEFNNAFSGAAIFLNALNFGNFKATKKYFEAEDCSGDGFSYKFKPTLGDMFLKFYTGTDIWNDAPHYPGRADCNRLGLTPLGKYLIGRMMDKHMIVDVDHMSNKATNETLTIAEERRYPVISSHSTFLATARKTKKDNQQSEFHKTDAQLKRIRDLGGLIAPILQTFKRKQTVQSSKIKLDCDYCSKEWAQRYLHAVELMKDGTNQVPAVALGSDFNGMIHHVSPRFFQAQSNQKNPVIYPFKGHGEYNVLFTQDKTGDRLWDFNTDGLAHAGMMPDFIQDLTNIGLTDSDLAPLFHSAEAYVQMWEKIDSKGMLRVEQ